VSPNAVAHALPRVSTRQSGWRGRSCRRRPGGSGVHSQSQLPWSSGPAAGSAASDCFSLSPLCARMFLAFSAPSPV